MQKLTIVRFKPMSGCHKEFIETLKEQGKSAGHVEHHIMQCEDEVVVVAIRDNDKLAESAKQGIDWLDQQRHLLQKYNEVDRHTIFMTGEIVEK